MFLEINKVGYDKKYYPRVNGQPDWLTILRYSQSLEVNPNEEFPSITVVRSAGLKEPYLLIDGLHRMRAYVKAGRPKIPAVVERLPRSKWMARSVELNCTHGRPLDTGDKAWAAKRLMEEGWKLEDAAQLMRMRADSLERIVSSRCIRITQKESKLLKEGRSNRKINGESYGFLKAPLVESDARGREAVIEALNSQHAVTSHDVLGVLDSTISILKAGVVNMANEEIASRVGVIRKLIKAL